MPKDEENLRILSIFHYVVAGLTGLFSLFPVFYIVMGILMLSGRMGDPNEQPVDRTFGALFVAMGVVFLVLGIVFSVCIALAGRYLSQRRRYIFCLVMAALTCAFFPFGTVLGVFTIVVLQKDSVRHMFGAT
jgi:membrane-anchored protein YejM (alkaline phosphatase superfamily)